MLLWSWGGAFFWYVGLRVVRFFELFGVVEMVVRWGLGRVVGLGSLI